MMGLFVAMTSDMKKLLILLLAMILVLTCQPGCARAEFEVSPITITPSQVVPNERFTVSTDVSNVGTGDGIYTAILTVNGTEVATKDIPVGKGITKKVSFTLTKETPGSYDIALSNVKAPVKVLSVDEVIDKVIRSMYAIDTYRYDIEITTDMTGVVEGEEVELSYRINSYGTVDNINKRKWDELEIVTHELLPAEEKYTIGIEMYTIGNEAYMLMEVEGETYPWIKERLPIGTWDEISHIDSQLDYLETGQISFYDSEFVRGTDCYVLQIIPDGEMLIETILEETTIQHEQMFPITTQIIEELVKDASMKQWIGKDSFFVVKQEIIMSAEMIPEMFPIYYDVEGKVVINLSLTLYTHDYNKQIVIELPPDVEEAVSWQIAGEARLADTELNNIQTAVIAMMVDVGLSSLPNPVGVATNDMGAFPDATSACDIDKWHDLKGNIYTAGSDKDGYVLYQHDIMADASEEELVNYVNTQYTVGTYIVDMYGTVTQVTTGYE